MGAHRNPMYEMAYQELYANGMSLSETAEQIGVARQCVYKAFKKRGFLLRSVKHQKSQVYAGKKFTLRNNGYYSLTTDDRRLMHRFIWERGKGMIPDGWDIHHINGDKSDNRLENLDCLPKDKHTRIHQREKRDDTHRFIRGYRRF